MADLEKIADDLSSLTVLEAADLAKLLEDKWGVSAAAPVAVSAVALVVVQSRRPLQLQMPLAPTPSKTTRTTRTTRTGKTTRTTRTTENRQRLPHYFAGSG